MIDQRLKTADGGGLAKALDYSLGNWSGLARYATAGNLARMPFDPSPLGVRTGYSPDRSGNALP